MTRGTTEKNSKRKGENKHTWKKDLTVQKIPDRTIQLLEGLFIIRTLIPITTELPAEMVPP